MKSQTTFRHRQSPAPCFSSPRRSKVTRRYFHAFIKPLLYGSLYIRDNTVISISPLRFQPLFVNVYKDEYAKTGGAHTQCGCCTQPDRYVESGTHARARTHGPGSMASCAILLYCFFLIVWRGNGVGGVAVRFISVYYLVTAGSV